MNSFLTPAQRDMLAANAGSWIRALAVFLVYQAVKHHVVPQALVDFLGGDTVTLYVATAVTTLVIFLWSWAKNALVHNRYAAALLEDKTTTVDAFLAKVQAAATTPAVVKDARGFTWIVIPVILLCVAGAAAITRIHVPLLNPHTKVQAAKTARVLFEGVRAFQVEEEKLYKSGRVPGLHAVQTDGKTLHQHIAVEELATYKLIEQVDVALQKLPTGGTLGLTDLGFVTDLEQAVSRLLALARPALGEALSSAINDVNQQAAAFIAQAKGAKS